MACTSNAIPKPIEPELMALTPTIEPVLTPGPEKKEPLLVPIPGSQNLSEPPAGVGKGKSGLPNLSPMLNLLLADWPDGPGVSQVMQHGVEIIDERVKVTLIMQDLAGAEAAKTTLLALGGEVIAHQETLIDAWVPVIVLGQVANLSGISLIRETAKPQYFN